MVTGQDVLAAWFSTENPDKNSTEMKYDGSFSRVHNYARGDHVGL